MRLATFNILHARSLADGQVDLDRFAAAVRDLDADVLALQEVDRDQPRSHGADLTVLAAEAMGAPEHRFAAVLHGEPGLWTAATGDHQPATASYGIALLSRYPVREWRVLNLPVLRRKAPVLWPGQPLAGARQRRAPRRARRGDPGAAGRRHGGGDAPDVHPGLEHPPAAHARLATSPRSPGRSSSWATSTSGATGRPASPGMRPLATAATFPVAHPLRQLDHILADGPVEPLGAARAVDTGLSDHRALVVDVSY